MKDECLAFSGLEVFFRLRTLLQNDVFKVVIHDVGLQDLFVKQPKEMIAYLSKSIDLKDP